MRSIDIPLSENEFERLNSLFPPTIKSSIVGARAVELVKIYFRSLDINCKFHALGGGIDLEVIGKNISERMEIKGTADSGISWVKLKVSGTPCYNNLLNDLPLYRVVSVYERTPRIHILKHSEDFTIVSEPRWALKARR